MTTAGSTRATGPRWLACVAVVAAVVLYLAGGLTEGFSEAAFQLAIVGYAVVGAIIVWHRPRHLVGWLMVAVAVIILGSTALDTYARSRLDGGTPDPAVWARWAQNWLFGVGFGLGSTVLLLVLPDGRLPTPRWRWVARAMVLAIVLGAVAVALTPGPMGEDAPVENPIDPGGPAGVLDVVNAGFELLGALGFLCAVVALVLRWRRATERERRQLAWILQGVVTTVALLAGAAGSAALGAPEPVQGAAVALAVAMPALGVAVAVLRERLLDIEVVVSRTLVYTGFSGVLLGSYAMALAVSSFWFTAEADVAVSLLATALVAALLGGLRERIQRRLERALFGRRSEPYDVLRGLGVIAERHADRSALIAELVQEVRTALQLPYAAVVGHQGPPVSDGRRPADVVSFPLAYAGRTLGALEIGTRSGDRGFGADERALLESAAARVAASVWAQQLDADLQGAREKLVRSREQERTRIRRDLHDGVGPVLAAATLQVDSLRRRLSEDDLDGLELADRVKAELQQVVLDIRALLEGLRPPNLDVGLVRALEGHAAALVDADIAVELDVDGSLELDADGSLELDPAVEVAAYRIASEAMTNVMKHASASHCRVHIALDADCLLVTVTDDGRGPARGDHRGVGLDSMAERAAELGGNLEYHGDDRGVTVVARLPMEAR